MAADVVGPAPRPFTSRPFMSVALRTQGGRASLLDALTCLAAQHERDLEVVLTVHTDDRAAVERVHRMVETFEPAFAALVDVHHVIGGGRSHPLNVALEAATGEYLGFLDDDDAVNADWVSVFKQLAAGSPGAMVRAGCVVQWVERRYGALAEAEAVSGFDPMYPATFDLLDTIRSNRSPLCCWAVPLDAVREAGITFDDEQRVCEDWKFELEVARRVGVVSAPIVTSIYRRWQGAAVAGSPDEDRIWIDDHERVIDTLDAEPTVLPPGSLRRIHELYRHVEALEAELGRRAPRDLPYRSSPER